MEWAMSNDDWGNIECWLAQCRFMVCVMSNDGWGNVDCWLWQCRPMIMIIIERRLMQYRLLIGALSMIDCCGNSDRLLGSVPNDGVGNVD